MAQRTHTAFLSSTSEDLTDFRDAVHEHLTRTGIFICTHQKTMGGRHAETVAACRDHAANADFYIGLIGMRRGWEPDGDSAHRSITEIEYDSAKPDGRFVYVTGERFPVPGHLRETDEQHRRQLEFRKRVKTRVVALPDFSSAERLAAQVVQELLVHIQTRPNEPDPFATLPDAVAERILRALDERGDIKKAERGGLERDIVLKLAKRITPDDTLDFDRAVKELENAVNIALDVIARGKRGSNEDDFVNDVLRTVGAYTQAGETERAVKVLDDAMKELDSREAEQHEALKRSRLALLEAGIEQDILRRDATSAARRVEKSVAIQHPDDATARFNALRSKQEEFYIDGRDKGINFSLEIAIEVARRTIEAANDAGRRGAALNDLGSALHELGKREHGITRLDQAIAVYREALKECTRERAPLEWALTLNNLGNSLWRLGEREAGTARLNEAVEAFRQALTERTRTRMPFQWAMTQNNLGNALQTLNARESGDARLEEAIAAYREVLKEWTRKRAPLDWAATQNNLAAALQTLGEHESDTVRLEEAVVAFREVLKEYTRERVPLDWAMTQNNLGGALLALGVLETETARLDEAVAAFREGLKERTPERVPLEWAKSFGNQGVALMHLADRRDDAGLAATAVSQIERALAVSREGGHVPFAQYYEAQLPKARAIRDRLTKA